MKTYEKKTNTDFFIKMYQKYHHLVFFEVCKYWAEEKELKSYAVHYLDSSSELSDEKTDKEQMLISKEMFL